MSGDGPGIEAVLARAVGAYERRFGARPTVAACAPGRVNLIGDHTDYTGGLALPMAIDRWCVAVGGPAADPRRVTLFAAEMERSAVIDRTRPLDAAAGALPEGDWSRYVAGVMAEFEATGRVVSALHVVVASSVPVGSGLSSSAALEVAVATMLEWVTGGAMEPMEKTRLCRRAEHRWAGVKCGLMDQMAAVLGREGRALLMDFAAESETPVPLPEGLAVLVADTGVRHRLGASAYGAIVESCERARAALGVGSLREVSLEVAASLRENEDVDWELYRRVYHVATENARVTAAAWALGEGDLDQFGGLMIESHHSLRENYRVSCTELDSLVDIVTGMGASMMHGVYGARMTGAGFGGCIVAAVAPWAVRRVTERLREGYMHRHGRECDVFEVRAGGGARPMEV